MRVIQCLRSLAKTYGLGIYAIMLPSSGFSVAHYTHKEYGVRIDIHTHTKSEVSTDIFDLI